MRHYVPSPRDLEIYYAVKGQQARQVEMAEKHEISQPRVSAIVASVSQWLIEQDPADRFTLEQRLYLATNIHVARLTDQEQQIRQAFDLTCQTRLNSGAIRPDARLIKEAVACCKELYEATIASIHAAERCRTMRSQAEAALNVEDADANSEVLYENEPEACATTPAGSAHGEPSIELPSTSASTPALPPRENANHTTCYIPLPAEPQPLSRQLRRQQERARARGNVRDWIADAFDEDAGQPLFTKGSPQRQTAVA